jgi:hypothetical protein
MGNALAFFTGCEANSPEGSTSVARGVSLWCDETHKLPRPGGAGPSGAERNKFEGFAYQRLTPLATDDGPSGPKYISHHAISRTGYPMICEQIRSNVLGAFHTLWGRGLR